MPTLSESLDAAIRSDEVHRSIMTFPGSAPAPLPPLDSVRAAAVAADEIVRDITRVGQMDPYSGNADARAELLSSIQQRLGDMAKHPEFRGLAKALARDVDRPWGKDDALAALSRMADQQQKYDAERRAIAEAQRLKQQNPAAAITVPAATLKPPPPLPAEVDSPHRLAVWQSTLGAAISNTRYRDLQPMARALFNNKELRDAAAAAGTERGLDQSLFELAYQKRHAEDAGWTPPGTSPFNPLAPASSEALPGISTVRGSAGFERWVAWLAGDRRGAEKLAAVWPDLLEGAADKGWIERSPRGTFYYRHNARRVEAPQRVSLAMGLARDAAMADPAARGREMVRRAAGLH